MLSIQNSIMIQRNRKYLLLLCYKNVSLRLNIVPICQNLHVKQLYYESVMKKKSLVFTPVKANANNTSTR